MNKTGRTNVYSMNEQESTPAPSPVAGKATSKRRWKPRRILMFGIMAWAAYVFFFVQSPDLKRLEQQQATLNQDMTQVQQSNVDLQKRIEQLQDPDYIAQLARSQFMMVKDGETLLVEPKQEVPKR
ncbi:FtsB family cell division protein [Tumebacillus permanentifrigoris]|uniref:Cell division protein DivIC n=1 Tax=Tumebacillus permanentifrigoris TaxID=378543 RepID=A0A316DRU2_9BACL|nr:septum formation initiator family protein [Tumebacillus permanentifrigoris]PWK07868.1 cell division protein DivIC [Tumebacillus permanentifrigoris]